MDVGTFTGFELLLGRATGVQVLIRTNGYLERIVPQGNGAASSLAGLSNTGSRHEEKTLIFLKGAKLEFSSFSLIALCVPSGLFWFPFGSFIVVFWVEKCSTAIQVNLTRKTV